MTADGGAEDGADPRQFHDRRGRHKSGEPPGPGRKARQLCAQVRDALAGLLARSGDEAVRDVLVVSVEPAPNTGRLMVTVAGPSPTDVAGRAATAARLRAAGGWLRVGVAAAIHRRKAPELAFRVV